MIKLLISLLLMNTAFAQLDYGAVTPGDLKFAKCYSPLSENLSKKQIYQLLRAKGHNLSGLLNDKRMQVKQFQDLYNAVQLMPDWIKSSKKSYEAKIEYEIDTSLNGVAAFNQNTLFINPDQWNNYYADMRTAIIFHELAHALGYNQYEVDDSQVWQDVEEGWRVRKLRSDGTVADGSPLSLQGYVSEYSMTNPAEDFAESVSSYRIKPLALKKHSLKKYNFIKDTVFLGQEFIDDKSCNRDVKDLFSFDKFQIYLTKKLNSRPQYYAKAYNSIAKARKKIKRHPKAIEKLFLQRVIAVLAYRIGSKLKTSQEEFVLKNKVRVFLLNTKDLSFLKNQIGRKYINKLLKNKALRI